MSVVQVDPATTDAVCHDLRVGGAALDSVAAAVGAAASLAELGDDARHTIDRIDAARHTIMSVMRLIDVTTHRAAAADGLVGAFAGSLLRRINDGHGTSVADLLRSGGLGVDRATLSTLTTEAARAWFWSLTEAERRELVALRPDLVSTTALAATAQRWQNTLDGDELRELFTQRALDRAGIDPLAWEPARGLDHNAATIEAVYEYYAGLYRADPDRLWWSGMAALIGPSFYGGFQDLDTFSNLLDGVADIQAGPLGGAVPGMAAPHELAALGQRELADELGWYQLQLMTMQQEIFYDMAPAHEAYLDGGVAMIERLYADDPYGFGAATVEAWAAIDTGWRTGDTSLVAGGNEVLLRREQQYVIDDDYRRMRDRPLTGDAVTWMMTAVGAPSVPGARSFPEVFPASLDVSRYVGTPRTLPSRFGVPFVSAIPLPDLEIPHAGTEVTLTVETPLPDGNIAAFDDRWALIEADTLPVYADLAEHHPDTVIEVLDTSIGERTEAYTIGQRIDDLAIDALTNWDAEVDAEWQADSGWGLGW